jgi:hypothetical protein
MNTLRTASSPARKLVVDVPGGAAAGAVALVMAGGAQAIGRNSPLLAAGMDCFIGASVGLQVAQNLGRSRVLGLLAGAAAGGALAAAGLLGGWPGALGAAALAALVRGVVVPSLAG